MLLFFKLIKECHLFGVFPHSFSIIIVLSGNKRAILIFHSAMNNMYVAPKVDVIEMELQGMIAMSGGSDDVEDG